MCTSQIISTFAPMKQNHLTILFAALFLMSAYVGSAQRYPYQDTNLSIDQRVDNLISNMTLDEKLSFLEHQNPPIERLGLKPYSWWNEALHGVARNGKATVYPMPIAMAATWDYNLVEEAFRSIAFEARQKFYEEQNSGNHGDYKGITFFTPNINIFRDPRWGRGMETFGEDPWLTARMGQAAVNGIQTKIGKNRLLAAACLKHLAVHSGPEGVRHEFDSRVSSHDLFTTYLPAFEYIIRNTNVQQVMCAYNRLNGEPCCTNNRLLNEILRRQWRYDGIVVTDCWALNDCWERDKKTPRHETHTSAATAAAAAFGGEVDLECGSGLGALKEAVDSGWVSEKTIDKHLHRVLRTRMLVGIDDDWYVTKDMLNWKPAPIQKPSQAKGRKTQAKKNTPKMSETPAPVIGNIPLHMARESIVLLKNNGVLPIKLPNVEQRHFDRENQRQDLHKLALVGPNINDTSLLLGNYNGIPINPTTPLDAFTRYVCNEGKGNFELFSEPLNDLLEFPEYEDSLHVETCLEYLSDFDAIVYIGGISPQLEGEELDIETPGFSRGDRTRIEPPAIQVKTIKALKERTKRPVIVVLCTGSALAVSDIEPYADAILVGWYGGEAWGQALLEALADCADGPLFGRLPVTFYASTAQLPHFEEYSMKGRTYRYFEGTPSYPFGFGLTYNKSHSLRALKYNPLTRSVTGVLSVEGHPHEEIIQVYLKGDHSSDGLIKTLVGFERTESRHQISEARFSGTFYRHDVMFSIPVNYDAFRYYDESLGKMRMPAPGTKFTLLVGFSSDPNELQEVEMTY